MRWMEEAWRHVGVHEIKGPDAAPEIVTFFRDSGHAEVVSDETAWCAAFVGACLHAAGIENTRSLMARSYKDFGTPLTEPRVGALVVLSRTADPAHGHVGFIAGWSDTHVQVLGGNQSDSVNVSPFARNRIVYMGWPELPATAKDLAKDGSRIVAASARQVRDGTKIGATQLPPAPKLEPDAVAQKLQAAKGWIETAEAFGTFALSKWPLLVGAAAVFWLGRMAWDAWQIKQARVEDHNTGKTVTSAAEVPDALSA